MRTLCGLRSPHPQSHHRTHPVAHMCAQSCTHMQSLSSTVTVKFTTTPAFDWSMIASMSPACASTTTYSHEVYGSPCVQPMKCERWKNGCSAYRDSGRGREGEGGCVRMCTWAIISYHIISYHIISYHIISYHIRSDQIITSCTRLHSLVIL